MSLESPASVLYDDSGIALAVSSSVAVNVSQSALLVAGVQDTGVARFMRASSDGSVFVTGSLATTPSGTQNVSLVSTFVTQSVTGSAFVFNNTTQPLFVSASGTGLTVTNTAGTPLFITSSAALSTVEASTATPTVTSVAQSATSVTIVASSPTRRAVIIYNSANKNLYLRFGSSAATTADFSVILSSNAYYEVPGYYTGQLTGIWSSAGSGAAQVTSLV
jgi:hypothetical protein